MAKSGKKNGKKNGTKHEAPHAPGVGVLVWHGTAFVDGPDCRMRGWFWRVYDGNETGDATGPYETEAEATADALGIVDTL